MCEALARCGRVLVSRLCPCARWSVVCVHAQLWGVTFTVVLCASRGFDTPSILNCDALQVYRGVNIGVAKATAAEQAQTPHYLLDCCDPDEVYDVKQWELQAVKLVESLPCPVVVGGSHMYIRALLQGCVQRSSRGKWSVVAHDVCLLWHVPRRYLPVSLSLDQRTQRFDGNSKSCQLKSCLLVLYR